MGGEQGMYNGTEALLASAEAYFQKHQIQPLLVRLLARLARERPDDPLKSLEAYLASERGATPVKSQEEKPHSQAAKTQADSNLALAATEPQEERDSDEPLDLDPMQLLLCEQPPSKAKPDKGKENDPLIVADGKTEDVKVQPSPGLNIATTRHWAAGINRALLEGWLPQPSPCCAAASVAGAFNALWGLTRNCELHASIREVADLMAQHCEDLRAQRQQRIERLLGVAEGRWNDVQEALDARLAAQGMDWASKPRQNGNGGNGVTKKVAMAALREELASRPHVPLPGPDSTPDAPLDIFSCLRDALGEPTRHSTAEKGEGDDDADADALPKGGITVNMGPDWETELSELFTKKRAVHRLRAEKPNTSEVGSWGIAKAAEAVAISRDSASIQAKVLLGRKGGGKAPQHPISKSDNASAVSQQWEVLKTAFSTQRCALLFHLTNHYALIYGWREFTSANKQLYRQVLTARKGQRPTVWMDFDEVRSIMLGWTGYQLMRIELSEDSSGPGLAGGKKRRRRVRLHVHGPCFRCPSRFFCERC